MSAGAARVACLGECMVELRARPDGLLSRGFGGDTLNTAIYLARLGVAVDYVTALGDDDLSAGMLAAWRAEGVGAELVAIAPGGAPGLYLIETDARGERRFLYWRDSAPVRRLFDHPDAPAIEAALAGFDFVYLSGITLSLFPGPARSKLLAALQRVREAGGRIAFDTNFRPRGWPDRVDARAAYAAAIGLSHIVFASVEDFALLEGGAPRDAASIAAELRAAGVSEAVVKRPEPSCVVAFDGEMVDVAPERILTPVDTTAAGDSFAAGYLAARLAGAAPEDAARAGHAIAGAVILHPGAIIPREATPGLAVLASGAGVL